MNQAGKQEPQCAQYIALVITNNISSFFKISSSLNGATLIPDF